jgi:hypothetical protein
MGMMMGMGMGMGMGNCRTFFSFFLFQKKRRKNCIYFSTLDLSSNVFDRYFINGHYFSSFRFSTTTAIATATTSLIYYLMRLGARFYDYLAPSEVRKKLSSKIDTVTLAS